MPRVRVELNQGGVGVLLLNPALTAEYGAKVLAAAIATAPVDTGAYKASIHSWTESTGDRAVTRVGSDLPYATTQLQHLAAALDGEGSEPLQWYTTKSGKRRKATQAQIDNWTRGRK